MQCRYALAPMTWWLALMTWVLFGIPVVILVAALRAPYPVSIVMLGMLGFFTLIYASVWFWWRPSWFEIDGHELVLRWPLRRRVVHLRGLKDVELVAGDEFRRRFGLGMRVGAGGLWGAFGLLMTSKETFSMYISRTDRFVLLRPTAGRAMLITPADPDRFVRDVQEAAELTGSARRR